MTDDVTQAVEVDAPADRVWRLLTDPRCTSKAGASPVDNLGRYVTGGEDQRGAAMQQETASAGAATTAGP